MLALHMEMQCWWLRKTAHAALGRCQAVLLTMVRRNNQAAWSQLAAVAVGCQSGWHGNYKPYSPVIDSASKQLLCL